jgi:hypothetical protein
MQTGRTPISKKKIDRHKLEEEERRKGKTKQKKRT